jgi:hypothetical protein
MDKKNYTLKVLNEGKTEFIDVEIYKNVTISEAYAFGLTSIKSLPNVVDWYII